MSRVLVTGGTGPIGRALVERLIENGHHVRVLSRRSNAEIPEFAELAIGDLETGRGLDSAVKGAEILVLCATSPFRAMRDVDVDGTRRILDAAKAAGGRPHVVLPSTVGADSNPLPYYEARRAAEDIVRASGLPWTVLRATETHDLVFNVFEREAWLPVFLVPKGLRLQPVDARDVAQRLAQIVEAGPLGRAPDFGGPEVRGVEELARRYLEASNRRKPVWSVPLPGLVGRAFGERRGIEAAEREGARGWEGFLSTRLPATAGEAEARDKPRDVRYA